MQDITDLLCCIILIVKEMQDNPYFSGSFITVSNRVSDSGVSKVNVSIYSSKLHLFLCQNERVIFFALLIATRISQARICSSV